MAEQTVQKRVTERTWRPVFPTPAGLIVSVDASGRPNIITLGEVFNLSIGNPVWVGLSIRAATYSHGLIREQGEFTVNLPSTSLLEAVVGCGRCSGRDGVDKFARFGLTPLASRHVRPPIVAECPVNLECRLVGFHHVGDHDLFIGDVIAEHVDETMLGPDGKPDSAKLDPLILLRGGFWGIGPKLHGWP
ncbi:MAG: flavin reductase family protein [Lentisphaeria bacterium]|nr:flavin reductase family protein [Lentisphaeria bacterium]